MAMGSRMQSCRINVDPRWFCAGFFDFVPLRFISLSMTSTFQNHLRAQLGSIRSAGLYKTERIITTPQDAHIRIADGRDVLNLCANNYLGLAEHPEVVAAAHTALDRWGYGLSSVRFICGTQELHKQLEAKLSEFLGTEDTILYSSCFDANGGLFETLLGPEDAIISDELNHASIIDGVRLCKAQRFRYKNSDLADLEAKLRGTSGARFRLIATDGVFSMDGFIADLRHGERLGCDPWVWRHMRAPLGSGESTSGR